MENPDFIQKILNHYTEELMPVPGIDVRYVSTQGERLKFRDKRDVNFYVAISLMDLAKSRHDSGKKILDMWVRMHGNSNQLTPKLLRTLIAQFP